MRISTIILVFIFVLLVGCKTRQLSTFQKPDWWDIKEETTAKVVKLIYLPEQLFFYEFVVNGETYRGRYLEHIEPELIVEIESKFEVAYNPNNPKENFLMYFRPIFSYKHSDTTLGVVKFFYNSKTFLDDTIKKLVYEYRVENRIYQSWCFLQSSKFDFNELQAGDIISVRYAVHNSRINVVNRHFRKEKENTALVYFNTDNKIAENLLKSAESINFKGVIYWLKHPNLTANDNRKEILENILYDEKFKSKFQNVEIVIL